MRINKDNYPYLNSAFEESKLTIREFLKEEFKMYANVIPNITDNQLMGYHYSIVMLKKNHTHTIESPAVYSDASECKSDMYDFIFKDAEKHFYSQSLLKAFES